MKLYFSCSITGGRQDQPAYQLIVDALQADGHQVLTASLARPDLENREGVGSDEEVFRRDIAWLDECDAVVAEISTPSHGVGYEIAYALQHAKPVICVYQQKRIVSKMLTGNRQSGLRVVSYGDLSEMIVSIRDLLQLLSNHDWAEE